jgi:hypothetical protein
MFSKKRSLFLAVLLAAALPLALAGNAGAAYITDGAVQNGTTGGWDLPTDAGVCVTGIQAGGTLIIDDTIHSRADCIAKTFPAYTTRLACGNTVNADGAHFWANSCVDAAGNGISLSGLDRTAGMCAAKGGTWKQACTSSWQLLGADLQADDGFCYTSVRLNNYDATTCPSTTGAFGYSWDSTNLRCLYSYGITGYANANLTRVDGTVFVAAGGAVDLSGMTSQGSCLLVGATWNNYVIKSSTGTEPTTPNPTTIATGITSVRAGCLNCHNNTSQYNSYAERWKTDYLKTGHKNMLRKVTAGKNWAGPDGLVYTEAATGPIDFGTATATISGVTMPLLYLFGDWMAPAPEALDVIVDTGGGAARYNGTNTYSCAPCHATGWSNPAAGVCSMSSKTSQSACETAGGTWYPSVGVQGASYVPPEPLASFPGITGGITGKWDLDGIQCARCHAVTYPPIKDASGNDVTTTHETDNLSGESVSNICFGCHQSIAKVNNGTGTDNDLNPVILQVKNTATAPAYAPEFNSHPIGNEFLNSPHAKFTGTIVPNVLGKYDLAGGGAYDSHFKSSFCRSGTSATGSILTTNADGTKIEDSTQCAAAGGTWWNSQDQGSCSTCHDVHQSTVPAVNAPEPFRRECHDCHYEGGLEALANIKHPAGAGTPLGDLSNIAAACESCHMPKATDDGFPIHLFRINTAASYSTFPTSDEFLNNTKKVANTAADGTYTSAVWVDLDLACGQCHGGGTDSTANPPKPGVYYFSKDLLATYARNMHNSIPTPRFIWGADAATSYKVNFDAGNTTCPPGVTCNYSWDFGDGSIGTGVKVSHPYASSTPVTVTLKVDTNGTFSTNASTSQTVTPAYVNQPPTAAGLAGATLSNYTVSFTDASTDPVLNSPNGITSVTVNWGDGTGNSQAAGTVFTHTYATASTYKILHTATDAARLSASETRTLAVPQKFGLSGTVSHAAGPFPGVLMILKYNGNTKATKTTAADGTYSFTNVLPGAYVVQPYKSGYTFTPATATVTVGPDATGVDFTATP